MVNLFNMKKEPIIQENTVEVAQVRELEIRSDVVNIEFLIHDKPQVDITLETFDKGPDLQVNIVNDCLVIEAEVEKKRRVITFSGANVATLEVRLPEDFAEHYDVNSSTGNINAKNLLFETMLMKTGAGNIDAANFHGKSIELRSGAGNVHAENLAGERVELDTGAGNVEGRNCSGKIIAKSGAGNIRFKVIGDQDLEMKSGAGNVHVDFAAISELNASIEAKAGLGNVSTNFPEQQGTQKQSKFAIVLGEGKYNHEFKAGVGSVHLMAD